MIQEDKARAYDKLLVKAKQIYNKENDVLIIHTLEDLFPELKESEDERMRKELIEFVKSRGGFKQEYIAWLEKQGNSADIVEPKFHKGDILVSDEEDRRHIYKVDAITNYDTYLLLDLEDGYTKNESAYTTDLAMHLWTIDDVRDGDIVVEDKILCHPSPFIAIFKEIGTDPDTFNSHCFIDFDGNFNEGDTGHDISNIHPATKEQRNILTTKMKEAGYEWDAKNLQLTKILHVKELSDGINIDKQKLAEWSEKDKEYNSEDYGIDGLWHAMNILEKTLGSVDGYQTDDGLLSHQCAITAIKKLYKQKPTETAKWSAQEEYCICELEAMVKEAWRKAENVHNDVTIKKMQELMFFLKTLDPNKIQQEWTEEDKIRIEQICDDLKCGFENFRSGKNVKGLHFEEIIKSNIDWLKSLRPQPKQEWSDEDETYFTNAIIMLKEGASLHFVKKDITKAVDWLKSLKQRIVG